MISSTLWTSKYKTHYELPNNFSLSPT